jgi:hypothetical protein
MTFSLQFARFARKKPIVGSMKINSKFTGRFAVKRIDWDIYFIVLEKPHLSLHLPII